MLLLLLRFSCRAFWLWRLPADQHFGKVGSDQGLWDLQVVRRMHSLSSCLGLDLPFDPRIAFASCLFLSFQCKLPGPLPALDARCM